MGTQTIWPFSHPAYIMAKPAGSLCNLNCEYCYYTEKANLYPGKNLIMNDQTLEEYICQYINMQTMPEVLFTWHGGEPLMRPITFYQKVIALQKKHAGNHYITNCIQTNGTLINQTWANFFRQNQWLVGVSIDGNENHHNPYRHNTNGKPSFRDVLKGINILNQNNVEWNAMAVINNINVLEPQEFYNFFKTIHCNYIQFAPIVERIHTHNDGRHLASLNDNGNNPLTAQSITPKQWGDFLCKLFDLWVRNDVGHTFIQLFDSTLANWIGQQPGVCTLGETCGHAGVIEYNGDVYSCDHFVFPQYKLGNIHQQTLLQMMYSPAQAKFGQNKKLSLTEQCKSCQFLFACHGECPKNRFAQSKSGQTGHNYLCEGYYQFFQHVKPYMDFMSYQLKQQQAPANVMEWIKQGMPSYK